MSEQPTRRRRSKWLVILITVILLMLLAEAAAVVVVFVSPTASERLEGIAASADRAWNGTEDEPGLRTRTARAAHEAYVDWVVPLWNEPEPPRLAPTFTQCVECHPDYASSRNFGVYMNHPLHAEIGLECERCHPVNPHPNPPRPTEAMCVGCHAEVDDDEACGFCHPPGSLPHFYLLGAPKNAAPRCDICHPKGAFDTRGTVALVHTDGFTGQDERTCLSCHPETACSTCHAEAHPTGWASNHGPAVSSTGISDCSSCHTTAWCSDRCHSVTTVNPFEPRPLPSAGVRP